MLEVSAELKVFSYQVCISDARDTDVFTETTLITHLTNGSGTYFNPCC